MFFTGEHLRADKLAAAGASIFICEPGAALGEAGRLAKRIASFSPTAIRIAKGVLNRIEDMSLKIGYEFEQGYTVEMSGHPDAKEALSAFAERRPPVYQPRAHSI
jgi:enoyl-CoA hydratase